LPLSRQAILVGGMIRGGFLDPNIRADLIALVRDGKAETRLTRRANALLLLDDGMSCEAIAKVLYLDDDTIRYWYQLYGEKGLIWLADFGYQGRACELTAAQQDGLKDWVAQTLPRTSTTVGEWIEKSYGVSYTRSALVKLLARLELEYRKPQVIPRKLDPAKQQAFIEAYENLLNTLGDDEAVLFADAVHPTHAVRPAGCWAPKDAKVALEQSSGRQRLNIHGAIDLETGATRMIEATTIDALSTIALLMAIALMYPTKRLIHVFLDNAKYHRCARSGMAGETRVPDQAALHSELLPAPRSDRTAMGTDASARNPQPRLRDLQRVLPICSTFPAPGGTKKLGGLLRFGHRQFPRHQPRRFSGSQGVGVYNASTMICVPTSLAQEVGEGLGAQAGEAKLTEVLKEGGGFRHVRRAAQGPFNMVLEARP